MSSKLLFLFFASFTVAKTNVPLLTGPVVDEANIIEAGDRAALDVQIRQLYDSGRAQLTVLTIPSLEGNDIAQYAIEVFDQWKLGDKTKKNGLLLIIAPNEHRMRLEVGRGLEGDIPDILADRILTEMQPYFRENRYGDGIRVAVESIGKLIGTEAPATGVKPIQVNQGANIRDVIRIVLFFIFIIFFFLRPFVVPRYRRYGGWGGPFGGGFGGGGFGGGDWGGGGGGGWSGGGGDSGGGGASGSW